MCIKKNQYVYIKRFDVALTHIYIWTIHNINEGNLEVVFQFCLKERSLKTKAKQFFVAHLYVSPGWKRKLLLLNHFKILYWFWVWSLNTIFVSFPKVIRQWQTFSFFESHFCSIYLQDYSWIRQTCATANQRGIYSKNIWREIYSSICVKSPYSLYLSFSLTNYTYPQTVLNLATWRVPHESPYQLLISLPVIFCMCLGLGLGGGLFSLQFCFIYCCFVFLFCHGADCLMSTYSPRNIRKNL